VYTRQNKNSDKSPAGRIGGIIAVVIAFFVFAVSSRGCREESGSTSSPSRPGHPRPGQPVRGVIPAQNPIEDMLRPSVKAGQDGVAAAILVDTSGSMAGSVSTADGSRKPKIDIARACALDLVATCEQFAREHPDQPITLGIYEFSSRSSAPNCRPAVRMGRPDLSAARPLIARMIPDGGTPIGDAIVAAKRDLNAAGYRRQHILVVTDGENTQGYSPRDVVAAMAKLPPEEQAAVYFVAFDISATKFDAVRDAGGMVLGAANETQLQQTLDYILSGKILVEQPATPGAR
jgi:hypothetical protein